MKKYECSIPSLHQIQQKDFKWLKVVKDVYYKNIHKVKFKDVPVGSYTWTHLYKTHIENNRHSKNFIGDSFEEITPWEKGTYVVVIKDGYLGNNQRLTNKKAPPKGTVSTITYYWEGHTVTAIKSPGYVIEKELLAWFPTKELAERFSKEHFGKVEETKKSELTLKDLVGKWYTYGGNYCFYCSRIEDDNDNPIISHGLDVNGDYDHSNERIFEKSIRILSQKEALERLTKWVKDKYPDGSWTRSTLGTEGYIKLSTLWLGLKGHVYAEDLCIMDKHEVATILKEPEEKELKANTGKFKIGDKVKIIRKAEDKEGDWRNIWAIGMDEPVDSILTVEGIDENYGYKLTNNFRYPEFVLELVEEPTLGKKIILDDGAILIDNSSKMIWETSNYQLEEKTRKRKKIKTSFRPKF